MNKILDILKTLLGAAKKADELRTDAQQVWDAFEAAQEELKQGPVKEQVALAKATIRKYLPKD